MINQQTFTFLNEVDETGASAVMDSRNAQGSLLNLQVDEPDSGFVLKVQMSNSDKSTEWHDIAAIQASDLTIVETITAKGMYFVMCEGAEKIRLNVTTAPSAGAITAIGTLMEG